VNKISRANVEVQPYAFTTKSLLLGHTDYNYLRYQVMDTPGILDHPFDERNTIEMQSVTALAHLQSAILFFIDITEQCGYPLHVQCSLFKNLKPLFAGRPLVVVLNKVDVVKYEALPAESKALISSLKDGIPPGCSLDIIECSAVSEEGINKVKETVCFSFLSFGDVL
jgi:nucleolar GTP-binding protein